MNTQIYKNGRIFTCNESAPFADAMIVKEGRILWIGQENDMPPCTGSVTDLKEKRVIPGFVDAHMHPVMLANLMKKISAMPPAVHSIEDLIREIKNCRSRRKAGEWIEGWGYDEREFSENRSLTRYDLDRGCEDSPVSVMRTCAHILCVNSLALKLAGIDRNTPDPPGGEIERDALGEPTGVLKENARNLIVPLLPAESLETQAQNLKELGDLLASQGVTSVCDMGSLEGQDNLPVYEQAVPLGFHQRAGLYMMWDDVSSQSGITFPLEKTDRDQQIFLAGLKIIGDGSVSGRTAWMDEPYQNGAPDDCGISVCSDELLESALSFCRQNRCQLSVHAMGTRTISRMIDRVIQEKPWTDSAIPHLRLEHVTLPSPDSIRKAAEHHLVFVTQPVFMYAEASSYLANLGPERTKTCYPIRNILDQGVRTAFSTDAPATFWAVPSDPFPGLKEAVTRRSFRGVDLGISQAVTIEEAICLYTREAAFAAGFPDTGILAKGFHADFLILDRDILSVPAEEIDRVQVLETFINGECIYQKNKKFKLTENLL